MIKVYMTFSQSMKCIINIKTVNKLSSNFIHKDQYLFTKDAIKLSFIITIEKE